MKRKLLEMRLKSLKGKCQKLIVEFRLNSNNEMSQIIKLLDDYSKSMTDETFKRRIDDLDEVYSKYKMLHDVKSIDRFVDRVQQTFKR
jgi:hypothetical protein